MRLLELDETGWDSRVFVVGRRFVLRLSRRTNVTYGIEAALLRELAPVLPLEIPRVVGNGRRWILTRYVDGSPWLPGADIRPLGELLRELHALPVEHARALGAEVHHPRDDAERFRARVLPLLDAHERPDAEALLDEHIASTFEPALTHADLGPEHVLVRDGRASGVIDWTDARLGDPAIDLAWALSAAPEILETYPVDAAFARRALVYHALGPWYEVEWGLRHGRPRLVAGGLAGLRARLERAAETPDTMAE